MHSWTFVCLLAIACDPVRLQEGRIRDCTSQRPIDGAMVQLQDVEVPSKHTFGNSDSDGTFRVAVPSGNDMLRTVAAPGYVQDETKLVNDRETDEGNEICLRPRRPSAK